MGICKKLNPVDEARQDKEANDKRNTTREPKKIFVQTKDGRSGKSGPKKVIEIVESSEKIDEMEHIVPIPEPSKSNLVADKDVNTEEVEIIEKHNVPEKTNVLEQAHETADKSQPVVNQNRFIVLVENEKSDEQQQKQLEEVNAQTNSQSIEVVDETQMSGTSNRGSDAVISNQNKSSDIAQKNIEFLKQSWDNMAELEDNIDNIPVMEKPQEPPFSMVVNRNKKKV
ncbi:hypothetical protein A2U01_0037830, partial [Trifolium medium]|nr:hypothetical protein [Trifolium medium]